MLATTNVTLEKTKNKKEKTDFYNIFTYEYNLAKARQNPRQDLDQKISIFHSRRSKIKVSSAQN